MDFLNLTLEGAGEPAPHPEAAGSKETAVFAAELRATDIPNVIRRGRRIHRVGQHESSSLLQAKVFLILKGAHVGECLEWWCRAEGLMFASLAIRFIENGSA